MNSAFIDPTLSASRRPTITCLYNSQNILHVSDVAALAEGADRQAMTTGAVAVPVDRVARDMSAVLVVSESATVLEDDVLGAAPNCQAVVSVLDMVVLEK